VQTEVELYAPENNLAQLSGAKPRSKHRRLIIIYGVRSTGHGVLSLHQYWGRQKAFQIEVLQSSFQALLLTYILFSSDILFGAAPRDFDAPWSNECMKERRKN